MHNPPIYTGTELVLMTHHEILVAQYQLLLSSISFAFALLVFFTIFLALKWVLPKFWHKKANN